MRRLFLASACSGCALFRSAVTLAHRTITANIDFGRENFSVGEIGLSLTNDE